MYNIVIEKLHFINISTEEFAIFDWKPPGIFKSFILDLNIIKENTSAATDIFFHINKGNMKIVYIKMDSLIYSIGSDQDVQYQILEALLEKVHEKFNEIYDVKVIFSYGNVTASIFKNFANEINEILKNLKELDLFRKVDVLCSVCKKVHHLYLKKSIMTQATSFPVPIVFHHRGHAVVCYIDQNFVVRGVEWVNTTG